MLTQNPMNQQDTIYDHHIICIKKENLFDHILGGLFWFTLKVDFSGVGGFPLHVSSAKAIQR